MVILVISMKLSYLYPRVRQILYRLRLDTNFYPPMEIDWGPSERPNLAYSGVR